MTQKLENRGTLLNCIKKRQKTRGSRFLPASLLLLQVCTFLVTFSLTYIYSQVRAPNPTAFHSPMRMPAQSSRTAARPTADPTRPTTAAATPPSARCPRVTLPPPPTLATRTVKKTPPGVELPPLNLPRTLLYHYPPSLGTS